ncbi:MAG: hypothetical protein RBS37_07460 [Bacteroidales bacterium]|jgi:hypothetical protein|nr:hypothetical protein [Bacteroidales bacterium]
MSLKKILRILIPEEIRLFLWRITPRFSGVKTYVMRNPSPVREIQEIDNIFIIREIDAGDEVELRRFHLERGYDAYNRKVKARLEGEEWTALAVVDTSNNSIAYLAWIVSKPVPYAEEFGAHLGNGSFLLKDGYCAKTYRHRGLHTRMEQERINYCVRNNAKEIYIQIMTSNLRGIDSVERNGYSFFNTRTMIEWSAFNIYRELRSFLKHPFRKVVS